MADAARRRIVSEHRAQTWRFVHHYEKDYSTGF